MYDDILGPKEEKPKEISKKIDLSTVKEEADNEKVPANKTPQDAQDDDGCEKAKVDDDDRKAIKSDPWKDAGNDITEDDLDDLMDDDCDGDCDNCEVECPAEDDDQTDPTGCLCLESVFGICLNTKCKGSSVDGCPYN